MLLGMIAALAILAATLVLVVANQQFATAKVRDRTQSLYVDEAALDSGVRVAELSSPMPTASPTSGPPQWPSQTDLDRFSSYFPHDANTTLSITSYDDLSPTINPAIRWDSNANRKMWIQATATYHKKTTVSRVLVQQMTVPFSAALPKAVTYSDTGIKLNDSSDVYAVKPDGSLWTDSTAPATYISAGGTWTPSTTSSWAEVGRFTLNAGADLRGPGGSVQSLGIKANGSVSVGGTVYTTSTPGDQVPVSPATAKFKYTKIAAGSVGYLSDYFDQAAQASLVDEAQQGGTPATAPTAPSSWTTSGYTAIDTTTYNTLTSTSSTTTFTAASDLRLPTTTNSGNLTLSRGTNTTGRTFTFQDLYVPGNLTLTGPVAVTCSSLYVGGTLTINNGTTTTVSDSFGPLYITGTGSSSIAGRVNVTTSSFYDAGAMAISNSTTTGLADTLGQVYCVGDFSVSGPITVNNGTSSLYGGGNVTLTGPGTGTTTDTVGLIYTSNTSKTLTFSGNIIVQATGVTANGDFTISGATIAVKDWLGAVYVAAYSSSSNPSANHGDVNWSGTASITSRDYTQQSVPTSDVAQPKPMWLGRYWSRSGTYSDEYGNIWVPGNSSWSIVLDSDAASTIMCPLLATTEHPKVTGNITFGSRAAPMVFFYVCDNNGIYPQVVEWQDTGTYYGLMVINESTIDFSGDMSSTYPTVEGAVFAGCPYDPTHTSGMSMSDIVLNDYDSIAFNEAVVGAIATSSLKTTTTITQTVPGSWQQLPAN
jgi:hypothetical protein